MDNGNVEKGPPLHDVDTCAGATVDGTDVIGGNGAHTDRIAVRFGELFR